MCHYATNCVIAKYKNCSKPAQQSCINLLPTASSFVCIAGNRADELKRFENGQHNSEVPFSSTLNQIGTYSLALLLALSGPMIDYGASTASGAAVSGSASGSSDNPGTRSGGSTPLGTLAIIGSQQVRLQGSAKYSIQTSQLATSNVVWGFQAVSRNASDVLKLIASNGTYTASPLLNTPVLVALP